VHSELPELLLGLLAGTVAIGLSPYAALTAIGLAGHVDLLLLPPTLAGLAAPAVWGTLAGMTLLDGVLSRYRLTDLVWNALHTIVRPLAAVLYASALMVNVPRSIQWAAALAALLAAFLVHLWILALRTRARTAGPISWLPGFTPLRLAAAAAIVSLSLAVPAYAAAIAAVLVLAPLPWWPSLWGAASLTLTSVLTALARPVRLHRWDSGPDRLPGPLRRAVEAELGNPLGPSRSARVTLARFGPRWPYRRGRLVLAHEKPAIFAHRSWGRARAIRLALGEGRPDHATLIETLEIGARSPYALCLGPDSPEGPAILAELERMAER
jgi:Domain of unknown function (DUF4126)